MGKIQIIGLASELMDQPDVLLLGRKRIFGARPAG
jgi:hypothetical protein